MSNHLKKITTRAKQLKKKHPTAKWVNLVKKASAEYRAGKLGSAKPKKKSLRQTGSSNKLYDQQRTAKSPGKRKSATGRKYIERRKNRSDMPGQLTGISAGRLVSELKTRLKDKLGKQLVKREMATSAKAHKVASKQIVETRKALNKL